MTELTFLVTYTARPGQRETFLRALAARGIPEAVRAEAGCLQYDYYLSIENADEILLLERWTSAEAQQTHLRQPHMAQARELKEQYVENTTLRRLTEVE
ncbi:MAG: antibiotic biosynthesis monooxygenase [Oscillospiraceae bacterium]|nr:antibiotic biosynthesis monooxygenase [Oscillospiraceae bacterium]